MVKNESRPSTSRCRSNPAPCRSSAVITVPDLEEIRAEFRAHPVEGTVNLAGHPTDATPFAPDEDDADDEVEGGDLAEALFDEHELLFAENERSILLVLQGLDASGKNGTIKHVVISMNPAGVRVAEFDEPTEEELAEHFLARYERELPGAGTLGVFARSHYEDVIVPLVDGELDEDEWQGRIDEINAFEKKLVDGGTTVVKCMLHISYDEQRYRFLRRLRRDDKRWKFSEADLETRRQWNEYLSAYGRAIGATSTDHAPWYIIPADHKWYRNWIIAHLVIGTLQDMAPAYPMPELDLETLRERLEPPN